MRLEPILKAGAALVLADCPDRQTLFRRLAELLGGLDVDVDPDDVVAKLEERELAYSTATPEGVAFPHALIPDFEQTLVVPCLVKTPIPWKDGDDDGPSQTLVFVMIGAANRPWEHVRLLARLARIVRADQALDRIRGASSADELLELLIAEDRAHG